MLMRALLCLVLAPVVGPAPAPTPAPRATLRPTLVKPPPRDPALVARDEAARALDLRRAGDAYVYEGNPTERFKARIVRDGTVVFDIDPEVQVKVDGICLMAVCKQTRAGRAEAKRRRRATAAALAIASMLAEGAVASVGTGPRHYGQPFSGPIEGGGVPGPPPFNVVAVQGRYGSLPSPLKAMGQFMDRTFEIRVDMAQRAAIEDIDAAKRRLPRRLRAIWADAARTPGERKAAVLALWDELDDEVPSIDAALARSLAATLQDKRRKGAAEGRATIVASVREHLPAGSRGAFTKAELATFNRREGANVAFRPYAPDPAAP